MLFPSPRDLPDIEIKPESLALQVDSLPTEPPGENVQSLLKCTEMVVKISYFCHFNVLNSVSLKFEVFETNSKKKISLLLFFLLFSLPCSPLSELSSLGVYISAWCISGLKMSVGESCSLVSCLLSHLAFRCHDLTPALYLANFSL